MIHLQMSSFLILSSEEKTIIRLSAILNGEQCTGWYIYFKIRVIIDHYFNEPVGLRLCDFSH